MITITPEMEALADAEIPACLRRRGQVNLAAPADDSTGRKELPFVADPRVHRRSQKNLADRAAREAVAGELKAFDSVTIRSIRAAHPDIEVRAVRRYLRELLKLRRVARVGNTYTTTKAK